MVEDDFLTVAAAPSAEQADEARPAMMGLSEKYLSLESNDCLRPHERELLLLRLDDLLRLLNAPGDWGYGTKLGELTKLLLIARDDLRENRS